jgi:hypothetical protein
VCRMESTGAELMGEKEGEFNTAGTKATEVTESGAKMGELERSEGAASGNELERAENMADGSMD